MLVSHTHERREDAHPPLLPKPMLLRAARHPSTLSPLVSQMAKMREERCILVDAEDRVTGSASKEEAHRADGACMPDGLPPHRAFSVLLFNSDDDLLVQKRSDAKLLFPSHWANTCCSHPLADGSIFEGEVVTGEEEGSEGVIRAARRKLRHELGMHVVGDLSVITRVHYKSSYNGEWGEHEMDYILMGRVPDDLPLRPNPEEVSSVRFLSRCEAPLFLEREAISPWFEKLCASLLLPAWWPLLDAGWESLSDRVIHRV